jgi:glutamine synthetase type III
LSEPSLSHPPSLLIDPRTQTEFNYFNYVPPRVQAFLREVQQELLDLNIAVNTTHNEVCVCVGDCPRLRLRE